ncbi:hypothetical protein F0562_017349 [Nyssa sinensis]|uniref:Uncharacterized protein n=1 Tax=Nyssa sinensis TaxID=561372 RepID=A0A5J4ZE00_9ASTE|nr:hypothetical protein F0562_017349 [Nyssa sinensis]
MGWMWKDVSDDLRSGDVSKFENLNSTSGDRCSTRKIMKSHCRTEEVEPGKFVRKCEKTEQIFKGCLGRPSEVVQSNKEYTEEDVTDQMVKGSFPVESWELQPFDFSGLRSDSEAFERRLFGVLHHLFEAADEMNGFVIHDGASSSSSSTMPGIPVGGRPRKETFNRKSRDADLFGLATDV